MRQTVLTLVVRTVRVPVDLKDGDLIRFGADTVAKAEVRQDPA